MSAIPGRFRLILLCGLASTCILSAPGFVLAQPNRTTTLFYPRFVTYGGSGGPTDDSEFTVIRLINIGSTSSTGTLTAYNTNGSVISGASITNPAPFNIPAGGSLSLKDTDLFGSGLLAQRRVGWVKAVGSGLLTGSFLTNNNSLTVMEEGNATSGTSTALLFTEISASAPNQVHVVNPGAISTDVQLQLRGSDSSLKAGVVRTLAANGAVAEPASDLFPGATIESSDYLLCTAATGIAGYEQLGAAGADVHGLNGQDAYGGATRLYVPLYTIGAPYQTTLSVFNLGPVPGTVTFRFLGDDGAPLGSTRTMPIPLWGKLHITDQQFFLTPSGITSGCVEITSSGPRLIGSSVLSTTTTRISGPMVFRMRRFAQFPYVSDATVGSGIALINPNNASTEFGFQLVDPAGATLGNANLQISPGGRTAVLLSQLFPQISGQGSFRITAGSGFICSTISFTNTLSSMSALAQNDRDSGQPQLTAGDNDGDGFSDIGVWRAGTWYLQQSSTPGTSVAKQWGTSTDLAVPGDYDGDAQTDIAVWRPGTGVWYVLPSGKSGVFESTPWGLSNDLPLPADYDGDGKTDIAVWRPETGFWFILPSNSPGSFLSIPWGLSGDIPVPGDYDGDGKSDIAVWRPSSGTWYVLSSAAPGTFTATPWGVPTDLPVPGDYDADGKTDIGVWRPDTGIWYILSSVSPGSYTSTPWGLPTDTPVVADYDRDKKADIGVFRPDSGYWFVKPSGSPGTFTSTPWGLPGDVPLSPITTIVGSMP